MDFSARALKIYNHVLHRADRISDRGWRRCFGWLGLLVAYYTFIFAPSNGIAVDTGAVNTFLGMVTGAYIMRGVEQINRMRTQPPSPTGGMVNNEALQA